MNRLIIVALFISLLFSCQSPEQRRDNVIKSEIKKSLKEYTEGEGLEIVDIKIKQLDSLTEREFLLGAVRQADKFPWEDHLNYIKGEKAKILKLQKAIDNNHSERNNALKEELAQAQRNLDYTIETDKIDMKILTDIKTQLKDADSLRLYRFDVIVDILYKYLPDAAVTGIPETFEKSDRYLFNADCSLIPMSRDIYYPSIDAPSSKR